ncbi:MAG: hypothetical protein ACKOS8_15425, partial [Gemmataceae bacterium]
PMAPNPTLATGPGGFAPPVPPASAGADLAVPGARGLTTGTAAAAGSLALANETFPSEPGKPGIARVLTFPIGTGPEKRSESIPLDEPGSPATRSLGGAPPLATGALPPSGAPPLANPAVGETGGLPPSGMPGNLSVRPADSRPAAFVPVDGKNIPVLTMPAGPGQPMPITPGSIPAPANGQVMPLNPATVTNPVNGLTNSLNGTANSLTNQANNAVGGLNNPLNSAVNGANANLNTATNNLNNTVGGLNTQMNNTVNGLNNSLNDASRSLNNTATNFNNQANSAIGGINNQVNGATSSLNNTITGLNTQANNTVGAANNAINNSLNSVTGAVSSWTEHPYKVQAGDSWDKISQAQYGTTLYAPTLKTFNQTHPRGAETLAKDGSPVAGQEVYLLPLDQIRKLTSAPR